MRLSITAALAKDIGDLRSFQAIPVLLRHTAEPKDLQRLSAGSAFFRSSPMFRNGPRSRFRQRQPVVVYPSGSAVNASDPRLLDQTVYYVIARGPTKQ